MTKPREKIPTDLGPAGRELWAWLSENFDFSGCRPIVTELCRHADRLQTIRSMMAGTTSPGDVGKLINSEAKTAASFARLWRLAGLHVDIPEGVKHGKS